MQISYACRYPGQQTSLVQTSADDGGAGRVLTQEGKLWQEKVLEFEVGMLLMYVGLCLQ